MGWKQAVSGLCLVLLAACSGQGSQPQAVRKGKPLLLGLVPERDIFRQVRRYEPVVGFLSRKTGIPIEIRVYPQYEALVTRYREDGLGGGFFGSYLYVVAHRRLGVEAVARPLDRRGESTYRGLIFVRKGSGIRDIAGLKGKRFAFVDNATTAGYLFPMVWFREHGIPEPRSWLGEVYFAGTHEDAIRDVVDGAADAGAAKTTVFDTMTREDPGLARGLVILARSEEVPEITLALDGGLDASVVERIRKAMLTMHEDPEGKEILASFGAQRFIPTSNGDFGHVTAYAGRLGAIDGSRARR